MSPCVNIMLYGKEKLLPRVSAVEVLNDYKLLVTFQDQEQKIYDAKPLLQLPIYKNLAKVFASARVECGTVTWHGDIDISPETLYLNSVKI